jgi:hypothetical protein
MNRRFPTRAVIVLGVLTILCFLVLVFLALSLGGK